MTQGKNSARDNRGPRGPRGPAGQVGHSGHKGARGPQGVPGPAAPPVKGSDALGIVGSDVLEIVETQIDDLHRYLDLHMKRIAQIQEQMDVLRAAVRRAFPRNERNRRRHADRRKVSLGSPTGLDARRRPERRIGLTRRLD
jgi:hypothetical protein